MQEYKGNFQRKKVAEDRHFNKNNAGSDGQEGVGKGGLFSIGQMTNFI